MHGVPALGVGWGSPEEQSWALCVAARAPWRLQAELSVSSTSPGWAQAEIFFPVQVSLGLKHPFQSPSVCCFPSCSDGRALGFALGYLPQLGNILAALAAKSSPWSWQRQTHPGTQEQQLYHKALSWP